VGKPKLARRRFAWWIATLVLIATIFYFSSRSGSEVGLPSPWDKVAHFSSYALLGFFATRATRSSWSGWGIAAAYGALDEWHQSFVPLRDASAWDWLADALGGLSGSWMAAREKQETQLARIKPNDQPGQ
jgi:VanZ family protein